MHGNDFRSLTNIAFLWPAEITGYRDGFIL